MPEYLLTARNSEGRQTTERVDTASADLAVQTLQRRGYSDIVLHTDDVSALYTRQSDVEDSVSPAEYVRLRTYRGRLAEFFYLAGKVYSTYWHVELLLAAFLVGRPLLNWSFSMLDLAAWAALLCPIPIAAYFAVFSPAHQCNQLMEALAWGRWNDVLKLLPPAQPHLPPHESVIYEAQARAGLGQIDQALALLEPLSRRNAPIPEWLFWGRVSDVFLAGNDRNRALEALEKSSQLAPGNATVLLDLATSLLRHRRDAARAAPLLEQVKTHELADILKPFVTFAEGLLALELGKPAEARPLMEKSLSETLAFRLASPLVGIQIDRQHAYLAIVEGMLGNGNAAAAHYRQAEPRLAALRSDDLLERCREAMSSAGATIS